MAFAGITQMLPASIIELNMKVATDSQQSVIVKRKIDTDFDDIPVETRKLKREISLPGGIENWNIGNFDPYLNFDENADLNEFESDGIVPEGERVRCSSISSVSSFHDDIRPIRNCTVKTFSTVHMDSGSTCISSDYSYESAKQKCEDWLDPEETYQNLDLFLQEVPEVTVNTDTLSSVSSLPSSSSCEGTMELSTLQSYSSSFDSFSEKITTSTSMKRRLDSNSEDEVFVAKQTKEEYKIEDCRYVEIRRKNNIASKNCRKTRKEKQREMEQRVTELEREKETLSVKVQVLEELIQAHKTCLLNAIVQRR